MVRLKAEEDIAGLIYREFQFLYGAIKRRWRIEQSAK